MTEIDLATKEPRYYTFPVASGLLTPSHVAKIGDAIWCFLWCVDRTTSEVWRKGECRGRVFGGYVTPTGRISAELGLTEQRVKGQLEQLASEKYLYLIPRDDGYIIEVRHSIKWKNRPNNRKIASMERGGGTVPVKSLVEGLKERLAAREAAKAEQGEKL